MEHTKGKWEIVGNSEAIGVGTGKTYNQICRLINPGFPPDDEDMANAALIAAAPDLLESMKALFKECVLVHRYGGGAYNQKEADEAISAAKAAVTKAESEVLK